MTVVQDHLRGTARTAAPLKEPPPRPTSGAGRLGPALVCCGVALVLWLLVPATSLPTVAQVPHWSALWVGLDALEALGLTATGILLLRRDPRRCLTAAATAALLVVDAWFDVLTSLPGNELATALAMAVGAELPLATLCAVLAVRSLPRQEVRHRAPSLP
ncbi:hypothetical protein [Streptomyces sporangiiformans]|uniref:hypothetical protein n=1 Tax=Streptomyces sporangiiformans TaxID=2315329 RepID=UPI001F0962F7|nr:hypothetical protein [Streptomyces sporangiiformans]